MTESKERLTALRAELARHGLDGFLVPLADEHQGEFVAPRSRRLAWLTGFTGSAGIAVVLKDRAALFTDGRYTLQAREEVDGDLYELLHITSEPPDEWIKTALHAGELLGYDPWLHTLDGVARLRAAAEANGGKLAATDGNPIDAIWTDQPAPPLAPAVPHPLRYTGKSSRDKRAELAEALARDGADAAFLSATDSIAWLLNIRGGDVPCTPVVLSFALVHRDGTVELFLDPRKVSSALSRHLGNGVAVNPPDALGPALDALGRNKRRVRFDPASAPSWAADRLTASGATLVRAPDPCVLPKALKTTAEIEGARTAHLRDGAALTRFLAWLAREAPRGGLTEITAADQLEAIRAAGDKFRGLSFATISGAGPNGAIVHYHATPQSNRIIEPGQLYLLDSGAQYLDGTTDVTRTLYIPGTGARAKAPAEARDRFTRVLKGHIAIATQRFPEGTNGGQLDPLARAALWRVGLDYDHGTGHGVGSYLNVHEGPQRISRVNAPAALQPGMIVSNEPGYYKAGAYGIRIENLVVVKKAAKMRGAERDMLEFETLTLAPIDRALIESKMLSVEERAWLDGYHAQVRKSLSPLVDPKTRAWLKSATAAL
jgi:Xaa-Pro aminopeptidase